MALAVAIAVLGLLPALPGASWLFALGSIALVPLLLLAGGSGRGSRRSPWRIALLALLLGAATILVLAAPAWRWLGWPVSAWAALGGFWILPWLLLSGGDGTCDAESGRGTGGGPPTRSDDATR